MLPKQTSLRSVTQFNSNNWRAQRLLQAIRIIFYPGTEAIPENMRLLCLEPTMKRKTVTT